MNPDYKGKTQFLLQKRKAKLNFFYYIPQKEYNRKKINFKLKKEKGGRKQPFFFV